MLPAPEELVGQVQRDIESQRATLGQLDGALLALRDQRAQLEAAHSTLREQKNLATMAWMKEHSKEEEARKRLREVSQHSARLQRQIEEL